VHLNVVARVGNYGELARTYPVEQASGEARASGSSG
jgi:hypothetical protein